MTEETKATLLRLARDAVDIAAKAARSLLEEKLKESSADR